MPYRIRRGSGSRPFQIVRIADGKVVGTSATRTAAQGSIGHRMDAEAKSPAKYKRTVDNKMRVYGETDLKNHTIRVNKKMSKNNPMHKRPLSKHSNKYPEVLDTIVHEAEHVRHPHKLEKNVRKDTKRKIKVMSKKEKQKNYSLFK
jgi:hypothetical protein